MLCVMKTDQFIFVYFMIEVSFHKSRIYQRRHIEREPDTQYKLTLIGNREKRSRTILALQINLLVLNVLRIRAGLHTTVAYIHPNKTRVTYWGMNECLCQALVAWLEASRAFDVRCNIHSVWLITGTDTMGCTSSTQTTAQDTTRPSTKRDGDTDGKFVF